MNPPKQNDPSNSPRRAKRPPQERRRYRWLWLLLLFVPILPPLLSAYVVWATRSNRYQQASQVPSARVAIVLGAGVYDDGTPTPMLADRIQAAVELYQQGKVSKLLMTGDNSTTDYDEVTAMKRSAILLGVSPKDITLDYAGFSTYESCYRARSIFGVDQAVLVTQRYHLPRTVYTCQNLGIKATGLGTPDWEWYGWAVMAPSTLREWLAVVKALIEVHVTRPQPTFLGPFEGIR